MDSDDPFGTTEDNFAPMDNQTTDANDFFDNGVVDDVVAEAAFVDDDDASEEEETDSPFAEMAEEPSTFAAEPVAPAAPAAPAAAPAPTAQEEECSALVAWRKQWREQLNEKAARSASEKNARKDAANKEKEATEAMRLKQREAKFDKNRSDQVKFLEDLEINSDVKNPWEAVVNLVDILPPKNEDDEKARMRALLMYMKGSPTGPGIPQ